MQQALGLQSAPRGPLPLATRRPAGHLPRPRNLRCHVQSGKVIEEAAGGSPSDAAARSVSLEQARRAAEASLEVYQYRKAVDAPPKDAVACLARKFEALARELAQVTEEEFQRLLVRDASSAAMVPPTDAVERLMREVQHQHTLQQQAAQPRAPEEEAPPAAPPSPPPGAVQQNIVPLPLGIRRQLERERVSPEGTGEEVLLQGFNWDSWKHEDGWYNHVQARAAEFGAMGFSAIWLPPPTQSVSKEGYMPGDLYNLNSAYGSEAELRGCIRALQGAGMKVLGDAVLNHRCAQRQDEHGVWNLYGGRMAWDQRAIVGDDPNFRGRGNRSSGDFFTAAPNVDHSQDFVKRDLQEWLTWMRTCIGFDGWRLDYVRGFAGSHVKDYMEASRPQFAVGEYWDALQYEWDGTPCHNQDAHRKRIVNWIDAAGGLATAFDITTKGILHAVFERCEYWRLSDAQGKPAGLLGWWPSRAVTFLENHDTGSSQGHWRFPGHAVEQGYAYILTHPGTPCVFWDHLCDQRTRDTVARLIAIRKRAAIHCRSPVTILRSQRDVYAAEIEGRDGRRLLMKIGPGDFCPSGGGWAIADCGHNWSVWEHN